MAAPKPAHIILAFLSLLAVAAPIVAVAAAARGPLLGGWKPIADPNAPEVVEIAKFAVTEHNKEQQKSLVFASVVKAEKQVVSGTNYRLVISAKDGGIPKVYNAVVYSKLAPKSLQLTSFEQKRG